MSLLAYPWEHTASSSSTLLLTIPQYGGGTGSQAWRKPMGCITYLPMFGLNEPNLRQLQGGTPIAGHA